MDVVALAARKGGVGKTLITASLAVLAQHRLLQAPETGSDDSPKVALIDLDPQGCLTGWHNQRTADRPTLVETSPTRLGADLADLEAAGYRYVFIDTPPGYGDMVTRIMRRADLVVIPVKPGELDVAASLRTAATAERLRIPYALLPNDATFRSRAMGQAINLLREANMPLLPAIHHRVGMMLTAGRTVTERHPRSRGAEELEQSWNQIETTLVELRNVSS